MKMDKIRKKLDDNPVYASTACREKNLHFYKQALDTLQKANISMDENIHIEFGLRKSTSFMYIGHRSVILKCLDGEKTAFKLELEIEDVPYIKGNYNCPIDACSVKDKSFTELANHHFFAHRNKNEDDFSHICCKQNFEHFEQFCEHVFITHRYKQNTVCLNFEQITVEKFDKFLSPEQTQFYPSFDQKITFKTALDVACEIIMGFDRYWIFMWNCQDFASWYLYTMGIPLTLVDPTVPDKLTGSGSQCSAQKVQRLKGWAWYKEPKQLEKFTSLSIKANVVCTRCEYLPPLTIEAMVNHQNTAHMDDDTATPWENELGKSQSKAILHYLCCSNVGLNLQQNRDRKWTMYLFRGSSVDAHTSVVFRPWTEHRNDVIPSSMYIAVDKRLNPGYCTYLNVNELSYIHIPKLVHVCDIYLSISELYDYITIMFSFLRSSTNCFEYVHFLSQLLFVECLAGGQSHMAKSLYTENRTRSRELLKQRVTENFVVQNTYVEDSRLMMSYSSLTLRGRLALHLTLIHRKYNLMASIYMIFMLTLNFFETIGEILFPLVTSFLIYLTMCVFSNHKITESREKNALMTNFRFTHLLQKFLFFGSMAAMWFEVLNNFKSLHSMAIMILMWLDFLFISRMTETVLSYSKPRYNLYGKQKRGILFVLKMNFYQHIGIFVVFITCMIPGRYMGICIIIELTIFHILSRKYPFWFRLEYLTGSKNKLYQKFYVYSIYIISSAILLFGSVAAPNVVVSRVHLLSFTIYFVIHLRADHDVVCLKSNYASIVCGNFIQTNKNELRVLKRHDYVKYAKFVFNFMLFLLVFIVISLPMYNLYIGVTMCSIVIYIYCVSLSVINDIVYHLMFKLKLAEEDSGSGAIN